MPDQVLLSEDHPIRVAFAAWKKLVAEGVNDFENTKKWAMSRDHVEGSLWNAFEKGYVAGLLQANIKETRGNPEVIRSILEVLAAFRNAVVSQAESIYSDLCKELQK